MAGIKNVLIKQLKYIGVGCVTLLAALIVVISLAFVASLVDKFSKSDPVIFGVIIAFGIAWVVGYALVKIFEGTKY